MGQVKQTHGYTQKNDSSKEHEEHQAKQKHGYT